MTFIICLCFFNCTNLKMKKHIFPKIEYLIYHNYTESDSVYINQEKFERLDKIDFNDFHKLLNKNVDISKSIELRTKHLFNADDDSEINIYFLYKINHPTQEQYLGYIYGLNKTFLKDIYVIFNVTNNKVESFFVVHLSEDSGFGSQTHLVRCINHNKYELTVSGFSDSGGAFKNLNCFTISDKGFVMVYPTPCMAAPSYEQNETNIERENDGK